MAPVITSSWLDGVVIDYDTSSGSDFHNDQGLLTWEGITPDMAFLMLYWTLPKMNFSFSSQVNTP